MIPVVYSEKMVGEAQSYSPSAGKPKLVAEDWLQNKETIYLVEPIQARMENLYAVHDSEYVDSVMSLQAANGFGSRSKRIAESLLYTTGAMLSAVSLAKWEPVVCAPVSGFHHAGHAYGGGFCTFNASVAAAAFFKGNVALVDCDMHYGDGSVDCLNHLGNPARIKHATFGEWYSNPTQNVEYLDRLHGMWETGWFNGVDLILFQAGADVWVHDPLGGVLTEQEMIIRDTIMFEGAKKAGIPIIWNLAGGYSKPFSKVIKLHTNTLHACEAVYGTKTMCKV